MKIEFNSIVHRHSLQAGVIPSALELIVGELAVNVADGKLYTLGPNGTVIDLTYLNSKFNLANSLDGAVLTYDTISNTYVPRLLGGDNEIMGFNRFEITNLPEVFELGENLLGSGVATWLTEGSDSNWQANSGYITITTPAGAVSNLAGPFNPTVKNQNITFPTFIPPTNPVTANSVIFALKANILNGTPITPASLTTVWRSKIYFGKSNNPNLTTPTFNVAEGVGSGNLLNTSNLKGPVNEVLQVGSGAGYFYLFIHDAYTLDSAGPYYGLKYGGNLLVKDDVTTVQILNNNGVTSTYKRYKSTNILNDALTIVVNPTT
jgi:hypothetical protein